MLRRNLLFALLFAGASPAWAAARFVRVERPIPGEYVIVLRRDQPGMAMAPERWQESTRSLRELAEQMVSRYGGRLKALLPGLGFVVEQMEEAQALALSDDARVDLVEQNERQLR